MQPVKQLFPHATSSAVTLPNGASVQRRGMKLVATDTNGDVILRFDGTTVELVAKADLKLSAPQGGVAIECRDDFVVQAREIQQHAEDNLSLKSGDTQLTLQPQAMRAEATTLSAQASDARLSAQETTLLTQRLATTAQSVLHEVERMELRAGKLVERARDVLRDTSGLLQQRSGRVRSLVERSYTLITERTNMRSREETSIDGKKLLLG